MVYTQSKLYDQFELFLKSVTTPDGKYKYREQIAKLASIGKKSIVIDYQDLLKFDPDLAILLVDNPDVAIQELNKAAFDTLKVENPTYAEEIKNEFKVRIRGLSDRLNLRNVSSKYIDKLVSIGGMVVRTSEVMPLIKVAAFVCPLGHVNYMLQSDTVLKKPAKCAECGEKSLELDKTRSIFTDYQVIRIQELPEELPPGQLPQYIDIEIDGDLVNVSRPGDRIVVTGIIRADQEKVKRTAPPSLFKIKLEGLWIEELARGNEKIEITPEDEIKIIEIARNPNAYEILKNSVAPGIFGHEDIKEALLLLTVGSPQVTLPDGQTLRGDINILLVGDPGTAKSEFLKYISRLAPRALYTSGRGSTAAGLTAAVVKETNGMMMLEAGAVVLADQGIACIDEFDKMKPEDRSVLHEVMEQQTVSVAKGGIVATLNARTSILAAANPVYGRYDPYKNLYENINLPIPLLTRFDLIYVIRDIPDKEGDEKLAEHILEIRRKSSYKIAPPIDFMLLRKYIAYTKRINPVLSEEASKKIKEFYLQMRSLSQEGTITITARQLETLIRLTLARARLLLKNIADEDDAERAIALVKNMLETVGLDVRSKKIDIGGILQGKPASERNKLQIALETIKKLCGPNNEPIDEKKLIEELVRTGKFTDEDAVRIIMIMLKNGQIYEKAWRKYCIV
ncbi:MAG: AAA domain-containing protein [Thaumarchaeota archaeon]|jgi:replicative DNA helicase Mcm|nr:AAA domain-containing protein [Nitrososphaerota archaeon]